MSTAEPAHALSQDLPKVPRPRSSPMSMNIRLMIPFYKDFLGARIEFESDRTAHPRGTAPHQDHRVRRSISSHSPSTLGLSTSPSPSATCKTSYLPTSSVRRMVLASNVHDHVQTTSIPIWTPDRNRLEAQVDHFDSNEEARLLFCRIGQLLREPY
jgi:hypothetical protein